jgi:hypothetical protein
MKTLSRVAGACVAGLVAALLLSCSVTQRGPDGGAVVTFGRTRTKAEVVVNAESGEIMVMTWGTSLKRSKSVKATPMTIGDDDSTTTLQPFPTMADPPDYTSRFYGQADWLRRGDASHGRRGWLRDGEEQFGGMQEVRHEFGMEACWRAGESQNELWKDVEPRRNSG